MKLSPFPSAKERVKHKQKLLKMGFDDETTLSQRIYEKQQEREGNTSYIETHPEPLYGCHYDYRYLDLSKNSVDQWYQGSWEYRKKVGFMTPPKKEDIPGILKALRANHEEIGVLVNEAREEQAHKSYPNWSIFEDCTNQRRKIKAQIDALEKLQEYYENDSRNRVRKWLLRF